jgi:hypothetical protein
MRNGYDYIVVGGGSAGCRGNDRCPKGRDAKRLGCAQESVTRPRRGGSRPKDRLSHVAGLSLHCTDSVRFLMYLRQVHHGEVPFLPRQADIVWPRYRSALARGPLPQQSGFVICPVRERI